MGVRALYNIGGFESIQTFVLKITGCKFEALKESMKKMVSS